jgi:hypothetical protein
MNSFRYRPLVKKINSTSSPPISAIESTVCWPLLTLIQEYRCTIEEVLCDVMLKLKEYEPLPLDELQNFEREMRRKWKLKGQAGSKANHFSPCFLTATIKLLSYFDNTSLKLEFLVCFKVLD